MSRKRAPGGGRKPRGEFRGKSATLTTRITPELRQGLEREARRNKRSLSQEVERRLRDSLAYPEKVRKAWGAPHVHALARLVSRAVSNIEWSTGKRWHADLFTGQAVRVAIEVILNRIVPEGPMVIPERIEAMATAARVEAEFYRRPDRLGTSYALGLLNSLEAYEQPPPPNHPPNEHYSDLFYDMPNIGQALGIKKRNREL